MPALPLATLANSGKYGAHRSYDAWELTPSAIVAVAKKTLTNRTKNNMTSQTSGLATINASPTNANIIYNEGKRLPATRISKVRIKEDKRERGGIWQIHRFKFPS